uniref:FLYWCH-type domain-containing protein n=1 Tax=Heliothis virescens TaxID=7102 RepID=A0A2A4J2T7_HELVI
MSQKGVEYQFVKSRRGKDLILINGYTFARATPYRWTCSTNYPKCRALMRLTKEGKVRNAITEKDGKGITGRDEILPQNQSNVTNNAETVDRERTEVEEKQEEETDYYLSPLLGMPALVSSLSFSENEKKPSAPVPPRCRDFAIVLSKRGKDILLRSGFRYYKHKTKQDGSIVWRCSQRKFCNALLVTSPENTIVNECGHTCLHKLSSSSSSAFLSPDCWVQVPSHTEKD